MATTSQGEPGPIGHESTLLDRIEFSSRVGAGILALTYVSGYLIATTYLGRFGIQADVSEFLRAKYIYIGFQYWMFVAIFGVLARAVALILAVLKNDEPLSRVEKARAVDALESRSNEPESTNAAEKILRRWCVLSLVLLVFSIQIMFLDPNDARKYLALQSILLLSIALYQTTFYREYSRSGYVWGLLYGRWYVQKIRTIYGVVPGFIAACLMAGNALAPYVFEDSTNPVVMFCLKFLVRPGYLLTGMIQSSSMAFWTFGTILVIFLCFAALFVTLGNADLRWLDKHGKAQGFKGFVFVRWYLLLMDFLRLVLHSARTFFILRAGSEQGGLRRKLISSIDCFVMPISTGGYCILTLKVLWKDDSVFNSRTLSIGTLVLSLIVLSNLSVLMAMRRDLSLSLGIKVHRTTHKAGLLSQSDPWIIRALMFAVLYIVSVLGFAYRVYPFIPVQKAGGNYSTIDAVSIHLTQITAECSSRDLERQVPPTTPYVLLEEDANWVYLAPAVGPGSAGGPDCWNWGAFCHAMPSSGARSPDDAFTPKVYTVNRRCIASTESIGSGGS
jgi:hypothetical protein